MRGWLVAVPVAVLYAALTPNRHRVHSVLLGAAEPAFEPLLADPVGVPT